MNTLRQRMERWFGVLGQSTIGRNAARIYFYQGGKLVLGLIAGIIVARTLGPEQKGVIDLFNVLGSLIAELGLLGFGGGLIYYLANKKRPLAAIHGAAIFYAILGGLLAALLGWVFLDFWAWMFPGLAKWIILLAFSLAPINFYLSLGTNIFTGLDRAATVYRVAFLFAATTTATIVALYFTSALNIHNVILLTAAVIFLNAAVLGGILLHLAPRPTFDSALTKSALRYGLVIHLGAIANILHFRIDQIMLGSLEGSAAVGLYAVSARWAELLILLDNALLFSAMARISSATRPEAHRLTVKVIRAQTIISLSGAIVLTLYGEPFAAAAVPLILLLPGVVVWSVSKFLAVNLTYNRGLGAYCSAAAAAGLAANVALNYLFIAVLGAGIAGAAVASTMSYALVALLIMVRFLVARRGEVSEERSGK